MEWGGADNSALLELLDCYARGCEQCGSRVIGLVVEDWTPEGPGMGPQIRKARCAQCLTELELPV